MRIIKKLLFVLLIIFAFFFGIVLTLKTIDSIKIEKEIIETKNFTGEESIVPAIEKVYDAVVLIETIRFDSVSGSGTGFIYKIEEDRAYIITNYHVTSQNDQFLVVFNDGVEVEAELIGADLFTDLAVLAIDADYASKTVEIGDSSEMELGEVVFTVGSPLGREYMGSVTKGILSARERLVETTLSNQKILFEVIQTDAAINPGNSGGPLVNDSGKVIGVNSLKIVQDTIEGMGFAIPIENAMEIISILEKGEPVKRPYLGVMMIDASDATALYVKLLDLNNSFDHGVVILGTEKDSDAEKSGLEKNDVVLRINDEKIRNSSHFRFILFKNEVGDTIKLDVNRDGEELTLEIKLNNTLKEN